MNLISLLNRIISRLNKTLKAEYQVLTDAEKALVRDNIHAANKQEFPNPNLLDNWYFGNPINQRGQTEYNKTWHSIDRWKTNCKLTVTTGGVSISNDEEQEQWALYQRIPSRFNRLEVFTGSILLTEVTGEIVLLLQEDGGTWNCPCNIVITNPGFYSVTFTIPNFVQVTKFNFGVIVRSGSAKVSAIKLERGKNQTLAHQDANGNWILNEIPSYTEELLKCQKYFRRFSDRVAIGTIHDSTTVLVTIPLDNPMRIQNPTISTSCSVLWNQTTTNVSFGGAFLNNKEAIDLIMVAESPIFTQDEACLLQGEVQVFAEI